MPILVVNKANEFSWKYIMVLSKNIYFRRGVKRKGKEMEENLLDRLSFSLFIASRTEVTEFLGIRQYLNKIKDQNI